MKHFKTLAGYALALSMVFGNVSAVFAEGDDGNTGTDQTQTGQTQTATTYTITINPSAQHQEHTGDLVGQHIYEAYQIFAGTYKADSSDDIDQKHAGKLSDIEWGDGVDSTALLTALKADTKIGTAFANATTAEDVANAITTGNAKAFANIAQKKIVANAKHTSTYVAANPDVTGSKAHYEITGLPAGYYLIQDEPNSLGGKDLAYTSYILEVAGDKIVNPKADVPHIDKQVHDETGDAEEGATDGWGESADHAMFESFQFKLIASLPADIDWNAYKETYNTTDKTGGYAVKFTDTMSTGVDFESIASVTVDGQTVTDYVLNPTDPKTAANKTWSLTIPDITHYQNINLTDGADVVVTYNAHLNENAVVNNASGSTSNENTVYLEYSNNPTVGGTGEMGKTPEDHVWVFSYLVNNTKYDATDENNKQALAGAEFELRDANGAITLIKDTDGAYRPVKTGETGQTVISSDATVTKGQFNIKGLDAGTYTLHETKAPAGFNTMADKTITISASHKEATAGDQATTTLDQTSTMNNNVDNKSGTTLPETGGMGTTIFYTVGGVLVIGAAVLLVVRKRMENAD